MSNSEVKLLSDLKLFTVEEANALLPSVRALLRKLHQLRRRLARFQAEAKRAADQADQGGGGIAGGLVYARLLTTFAAEMSEFESLGVQLKDFDRGLIDFPSVREGRVVLLCWQLGEGDQLEWWHDMDAGFAGRTRL